VKHASAVRFDEFNTHLHDHDTLSLGALILSGCEPSNFESYTTVDICDHPHLETPLFTIQLALPPTHTPIGCEISTDTYHNLPYISRFIAGTPLASSLLLHGRYNSSFWILSVNSQEFLTAKAVVDYLQSLQQATSTTYLPCILAHRIASSRTTLAGSRVLFNQIRLINEPIPTSNYYVSYYYCSCWSKVCL
jgi:hypothetical protein